ncbi:MAG: acylphosphatase [Thermoplasmata archaeon]
MKKRATIIISGDVQDVGFRGLVMRMAQKMNLVGYVENLPDGSVKATCEGEEKAIKTFIKMLDIRNRDINVEKVDVKWSKAQGKFKYFEVKYSDLGAEMFQGFATAGRKLSAIDHNLGNKIDAMHSDMNSRFDTLDTKYGEFGKDMKVLRGDIGDMKLLASEFREFKDLFAIYVKHQLDKDSQ